MVREGNLKSGSVSRVRSAGNPGFSKGQNSLNTSFSPSVRRTPRQIPAPLEPPRSL
jgi:hypothetical protein